MSLADTKPSAMFDYHMSLEGLFSAPFLTQFTAQNDTIAKKIAILLFNGLNENLMFRVTVVRAGPNGNLISVFTLTAPGGLIPLAECTLH